MQQRNYLQIPFRAGFLFCIIFLSALFGTTSSSAQTAYALWCESNHTLYFTASDEQPLVNGSYTPYGAADAVTITQLWSGTAITNSGYPTVWRQLMKGDCQKVVFEPAFKNVHPTSTYNWFNGYNGQSNLTEIVGIENLNTDQVTNMAMMFYDCQKLQQLDLSHFNTSNVQAMNEMFYRCKGLTSLDVSSFDTRNVTNMLSMFDNCSGLSELNLKSFNTSNVTNMRHMFQFCSGLTSLDLSSFDTHNVTDMMCMFQQSPMLEHIYVGDGWSTAKVSQSTYMFSGDTSLEGGHGTKWSADKTEHKKSQVQWAHVDTPENPGLLTSINDKYIGSDYGDCKLRPDGTFTCKTFEGVSMVFKVLDPVAMTCQVGNDTLAIDPATTGTVTIPNVACKYSVVGIGRSAFFGCSEVTAIWLPESIQFIGDYAFYGCSKLGKIQIPKAVYAIGNGCFGGCSSLTEVEGPYIPGIGDLIPPSANLIIIGYKASDDNYDVVIPRPVTSIGTRTFSCLPAIRSMRVEEGNTVYDSRDYCNAIILTSTNTLIAGCQRTVIPETVTSIAAYAFEGHTGLAAINIPKAVNAIGDNAFEGCTGILTVTSYVETPFAFADNVFSETTYQDATLLVPAGKMSVYQATGGWKNFKNIVEMTSENIQFADAEVKRLCVANWDTNNDGELSYTEAKAVTSLNDVFKGNSKIVSFDELQYFTGIETLTACAFQNCFNLNTVVLPPTLKYMEHSIFENCYLLQKADLPEGLLTIDWAVFGSCNSIHSIVLPKSVTTLDVTGGGSSNPFSHCYMLNSLTVAEGNEYFDSRDGCNAIIEKATNKLRAGCNTSVVPDGVVEIAHGAFGGCKELTRIVLPSTVKILGNQVFIDCPKLTSIDLNNVESIGYTCFSAPLTSLHIPATITSLSSGNSFADHYNSLQTITVDENNPSYDSRENCNAIILKNSPNTLLRDNKPAVNVLVTACRNTTIPASVRAIGSSAFRGLDISTIDIPEGVESILSSAFIRSKLQTVKLPKTLTFLDEAVFYDCKQLTTVIVQNTEPLTISDNTFNLRANMTLFVPAGCKGSYEEATYWKNFKEIIEMDNERLLYANDVTSKQGRQVVAPLILDNGDEQITALQVDVELPQGVTPTATLTSRKANDHVISTSSLGDGCWRIVVLSMSNTPFTGTSGAIVNLALNIGNSSPVGRYTVTLKNIELATAERAIRPSDTTSAVTIEAGDGASVVTGDANGDGNVTVFDAVQIVNYVLGNTPTGFVPDAADIDGNGSITVFDAVQVVNIVLNRQ